MKSLKSELVKFRKVHAFCFPKIVETSEIVFIGEWVSAFIAYLWYLYIYSYFVLSVDF